MCYISTINPNKAPKIVFVCFFAVVNKTKSFGAEMMVACDNCEIYSQFIICNFKSYLSTGKTEQIFSKALTNANNNNSKTIYNHLPNSPKPTSL